MGEEIERDFIHNKMNSKVPKAVISGCDDNEKGDDDETKSNEDEKSKIFLQIKILLIQNLGILLGFFFMLFMAIYSEAIAFGS